MQSRTDLSPFVFEVGLSRFRERECVRHLNARGVGVPLLASFTNGIVTRLLPGQPLDLGAEEMSDIAFARCAYNIHLAVFF